jgi:hypothetical protein
MTQREFDEMPGVIVHLTTDDGRLYLCSGEPVPQEPTPLYEAAPGRAYPNLLGDRPNEVRKQCQACRLAAIRRARP